MLFNKEFWIFYKNNGLMLEFVDLVKDDFFLVEYKLLVW